LTPGEVGLPVEDGRRVTGLRRPEVAELAGISADYYLRLEQGRDILPSDQVLNALGRALRLDSETMLYMHRLVHPSPGRARRLRDARVDDSMLRLIELWSATPALIIDGCMDVLVANPLATALGPGVFEPGGNLALGIFTPYSRETVSGWEELASHTVAALRLNSDPDDPRLHEIVGQLSLDPDFSRLWARHDVRSFSQGTVQNYHPKYGLFMLEYQDLAVPGRAGHILTTFFATPGTLGEEVLAYLRLELAAGRLVPGGDLDQPGYPLP
jgi:transcriptional regulator with XRE-family HTH domain